MLGITGGCLTAEINSGQLTKVYSQKASLSEKMQRKGNANKVHSTLNTFLVHKARSQSE